MTAIVPVSAPRLRPVSDFRIDVERVAPVRVRARLARGAATAAGGVLHVDVDQELHDKLHLRCAPALAAFAEHCAAHHPTRTFNAAVCESEFYIEQQSLSLARGTAVELVLVPDRFRRRRKGTAPWSLYLRVCELSEVVDAGVDIARRYDDAEAELHAAEANLKAARGRYARAVAERRAAAEDYFFMQHERGDHIEVQRLFIERAA